MEVIAGTSGYSYDWWGPPKGVEGVISFYPTKNTRKWLNYYASEFGSVEINFTRYRRLTRKMCEGWLRQVPSHFKFTLKVPTYMTHMRKLNGFAEWWPSFEDCLRAFPKSQLGALLFQFPPSFHQTPRNLKKLEQMKPFLVDYECAFEFRDISWYHRSEAMETLFRDPNWILAVLHLPEVRQQKSNFGNLPGGIHGLDMYQGPKIYHRFHGTFAYSHGTYGYEYLSTIFSSLETDFSDLEKGYFYFNNTDTWECASEPYTRKEIYGSPFRIGVPLKIPIVSSAIFDVRVIQQEIIPT